MERIKRHVSRALGILVAPMVIVLAIAQPVSAAPAASISIGSSAVLEAQGVLVRVPLTITCETGKTAFVSVNIAQRSGKEVAHGYGNLTTSCTGSAQTVKVSVIAQNKAFHAGQAAASGVLTACNETACATADEQRVIQLLKK